MNDNLIATELLRLIDTANAPIFGIDALGRVNEWNQAAARITGFTKEEVMGRDLVGEFITNEFKASVKDVLDKALEGVQTANYEFPLYSKAGDRVDVLLNSTSRRDERGEIVGVVGVGQDITELKAQESKSRQAARLAAFGGLTGGIAHDFNNLLQVITGNLSLISMDESDNRELVDDALEAARNGSKLVQSLLAFSRKQTLTPMSHNLGRLLENFERSLARMLGASVTFDIDVPPSLTVLVDKQQLETALLNLCLNAKAAMNNRGIIKVTAKRSSHPGLSTQPLSDAASNTKMILLQISDNGCGIEPSDLPHVTEPFYTTKTVGKGSGLGLSSVSGFVEQSGGSMAIESTRGVGTTINLYLPPGIRPNVSRIRGKATVLIVDDEPLIRRLLTTWLLRNDYEVLVASNADEAIARLAECDGAVDFLFSDLVMPGEMDGSDLVAYVAEAYPAIVSVIATGYSDQILEATLPQKNGGTLVISKPYKLPDVTAIIEKGLSSRAPHRTALQEGKQGYSGC